MDAGASRERIRTEPVVPNGDMGRVSYLNPNRAGRAIISRLVAVATLC